MRHFAFIRAINTGGRRLTNEELLEPFHQFDFTEVAAYQAAGNITFLNSAARPVDAQRLEIGLAGAYGFEAPVFLRTHSEMNRVVEAQPFSDDDLARTERRAQVSFMHRAPSKDTMAEVMALVPMDDRVAFSGMEWHWLPKHGVSDSQLPVRAIEGLVGPMTMRTLGTLSRMLNKFS